MNESANRREHVWAISDMKLRFELFDDRPRGS